MFLEHRSRVLLLLAASACREPAVSTPAQSEASDPPRTESASRPSTSQPSSQPSSRGLIRAQAAALRLQANEGGRHVLAAAEAHGGLEAWFGAEAIAFAYNYRPVQGTPRNSFQVIDLLGARAYHESLEPFKGRYAWDGTEAWLQLEGDAEDSVRFWALTPYYFVGMPFVLSDPGVRLETVDDDPTLAGFPKDTSVVRASFAPGTGDAPDDYYVLYLARDTSRVLGLRYVVSYAPFMQSGQQHTPEKLLVYSDFRRVGEIQLSHRHDFFSFDKGRKGKPVSVAELSRVELGARFEESRLEMPPGARLDTSLQEVKRPEQP